MIKKLLTVTFLTILSFSVITAGDFKKHKRFGLGLMLGEPSGISGKLFLNENNAIDFGVGYSLATDGNLTLHADYLHHNTGIFNTAQIISLHYGFGAKVKTYSNQEDSFGVRGVIGITWEHQELPFDAFIELAPVFKLLPRTELEIDASLGARYYFDSFE